MGPELNIDEIFDISQPQQKRQFTEIIKKPLFSFIKSYLKLNEVDKFIAEHSTSKNFDHIEEIFEHLNFSYNVTKSELKNISPEGRLIVVANHPLGGLDGLALLHLIGEIRQDVKIVANSMLMKLQNLNDLFLPYDVFSYSVQKKNIQSIDRALENNQCVIFFPSAEVSRMNGKGISDTQWHRGPIRYARKHNAPVVPIFVDAKNSPFFYLVSMLHKKVSTALLVRELFAKRNKNIRVKIGETIPSEAFVNSSIAEKEQIKLLKKHLYKIAKNKNGIFITEKSIIHPVSARTLKSELNNSLLLGKSADNKSIYIADFDSAPNVVKEIARLRELTFRKVGEGTGKAKDIDKFDKYYKHLVLWDDNELEIAGAYRMGICSEILSEQGIEGLYNYSQYDFSERLTEDYLGKTLELGRSFIQEKYWRSNALDLMWQGIGIFLKLHPSIQYLFGAVSMSDKYSHFAKSLIVSFYKKWYIDYEHLVRAKNPFFISGEMSDSVRKILNSEMISVDFRTLKISLRNAGFSIPVLFRKYSELCNPGGVRFLDFAVDKDFSNTVDGLILVDLEMLTDDKIDRYFAHKSLECKVKIPDENVRYNKI